VSKQRYRKYSKLRFFGKSGEILPNAARISLFILHVRAGGARLTFSMSG
jgi:hypothetical protein